MNRKKWLQKDVPLAALALKLSEEAAEVGKEVSDMMMDYELMEPPFSREDRIVEELDHVEFIAAAIRKRLMLPVVLD